MNITFKSKIKEMSSLSTLLIILMQFSSIYFIGGCSGNLEDKLISLEEQFHQKKGAKIHKKLQVLMYEAKAKEEKYIRRTNKATEIKTSMYGNITGFADAKTFHFYHNKKWKKITIKQDIYNWNFSYRGNYVILTHRNGKSCKAAVLDMDEARKINIQNITLDCHTVPTVSDNARYIYFTHNNSLYYQNILSQELRRQIVSASFLKPKYPDIHNRFYIYPINRNGIAFFHGNAGVYQLYFYPGTHFAVTALSRVSKLASKPKLFPLYHSNVSTKYSFYTGDASKLSLQEIIFTEKYYNLDKTSPFIPAMDISHRANVNDTLLLKNNAFYLYTRGKEKKQATSYLYFSARNFATLGDTLVYQDLKNRIYTREISLSPIEQKLLSFQAKVKIFTKKLEK